MTRPSSARWCGVIGACIAFLGLAAAAAWLVGWLAGGEGWLAGLAAAAGGLMALGLAVWLFVPVVLALSGLFLDSVAAAVERRFYPALPPASRAGLGRSWPSTSASRSASGCCRWRRCRWRCWCRPSVRCCCG
ncbi:EI24 domain-containing protein [Siccirubricoccus deserti]